jgi:hypothetical protein
VGGVPVVTRVLLDAHHADLLESMHLLLTDRFGWDCYIPVGQEWWDENIWSFGKWAWGDDRLARQFLTVGNVERDDAHPDRLHNVITFGEAANLHWDYVIASVPDNYRGYHHFARQTGAKFVIQVGNTNQPIAWELDPLVLNSSEMPLQGRGVTYHQEFSLIDFAYSPATSQIIGSFVNCMESMACWHFLDEARRLMPERTFRIHGIDGPDGNVKPTRDVGTLMRSYGWGWHDKVTGDGFGHVIHNWAAVGRPLIGHASHYAGKMAGPLWEDGVTCIDLDRHAVNELPGLLERLDNLEMGLNIRSRFEELVDYEAEAEQIRALLA